jgi:hypothetical protein
VIFADFCFPKHIIRRMRSGCAWILALFLAVIQVYPLGGAPHPSIKDQVSAVPIGGKLTVRKMDGTEYHGHLEAAGPETFSIDEVDLRTTVTISYADVEQIRKNYGGKGFGGQRVDPKRSLIIGAIFVGALLTIVFILVANDKS